MRKFLFVKILGVNLRGFLIQIIGSNNAPLKCSLPCITLSISDLRSHRVFNAVILEIRSLKDISKSGYEGRELRLTLLRQAIVDAPD